MIKWWLFRCMGAFSLSDGNGFKDMRLVLFFLYSTLLFNIEYSILGGEVICLGKLLCNI